MGSNDPKAFKEWEQSRDEIIAIYSFLLIVFLFGNTSTAIVFYRMRHRPMIRFRTPSLTLLAVAASTIICINICLRMLFTSRIPCWIQFWITFVMTPMYMLAHCLRAWRLIALYRIAEASVIGVRLISKSSDTPSYDVTSDGSWAFRDKHQDCQKINAKNRDNYCSFNQYEMQETFLDYPQTPAGVNPMPKTSTITQWIINHRNLVRTAMLWRGMAFVFTILVIAMVFIQLFSNNISLDRVPIKYESFCHYSWEIYPLLATEGGIIILAAPMFIFFLKGVHDTFGIKKELLFIWISWVAVFLAYILGTMFLGNKGIFPPVCYVFIAAFVTEFICVCFPIICSLREKRQQKQLLEQAYGNNTSAEANDRPSLTCNNRYSNAEKALSRQSFQALLNGKTTFELFKAFTVRDLSVENVHFYDACRKILNYVGNSPVLPEEQQLLAAYQIGLERRLAWLRDTFLLESSDYQINLPHIQQRDLLQMIDGDISDFNLRVLQAAQHEIETLMFFDTYLRYLSSQSALELSNTLTSENNETRRKGQSKFASLIMPIRSLL